MIAPTEPPLVSDSATTPVPALVPGAIPNSSSAGEAAPGALLVLADGTVLRGLACGARGTAIGEVVFNTGMTGYQEVMTDPSYQGQLVTFTYPELGNTGVNPQDQEANRPHVKGLITRRLSPVASNWRATEEIEGWLQGVVEV
jgi:carbamoyl-phosphate synthase small subunit